MFLLLVLAAVVAGVGAGPGPGPGTRPGSDVWPILSDQGSGCSCKIQEWSGYYICFDLMTCVHFPRNVSVPTSTFLVKATRIAELVVGDLDRMHHLTEFTFDNSQLLHHVQPGVFRGMDKLLNLSVSFHPHLRHLEPGAFEGLAALRSLSLIKNGFVTLAADVVPALGPATLPALRVLTLDENHFPAVAAGDLQPMAGSALERLSLVSCDLVAVHPDAMLPLRGLAALRLGDNNLDVTALGATVDRLTAAGLPLHSLDLDNIGVHGLQGAVLQLLHAVARSPVTELILKRNEMEKLEAGAFPAMPGLRHLDLSHAELVEGAAGTLNDTVMPALETLDLSGNRLPGLTAGFLSNNLISLDLSANSGDAHQGNAYFDLGTRTFANMTRLRSLHLSFNRILRLTNESFVGLAELRVLTMRNSSLFRLDAGVFRPLERLEHLNLERNLFPAYRPMRADIFLGLGRLQVLLLGGCDIKTLGEQDVFRHLVSLTHLGLQDNAIATLDGTRAFRPLRSLAWLDVSRNRVASWRSERLFAGNPALRQLHAAGNHLTHLSTAMIEDLLALDQADLADNIFNCGCDFYRPVHAWLAAANQSERHNLTRLFTYKCLSPDRWRDHPIADYMQSMADKANCKTGLGGVDVALPATLGVLLPVLAGAAALAFRYRHRVRYWASVALHGAHGAHHGRDALAAYVNYQYDAFVSYSSEDQAFVHGLVTALEQSAPYFRLCVYERDFAVGAAITEAVLGSVALSRRVLLVVSQAFARSHWCAWEAHIAHHQRLLSDHALIVVKLGPVDDGLLTPTLRYLLRTRIYLEFDADPERQRVFWDKLRATLSPPLGKGRPPADDDAAG